MITTKIHSLPPHTHPLSFPLSLSHSPFFYFLFVLLQALTTTMTMTIAMTTETMSNSRSSAGEVPPLTCVTTTVVPDDPAADAASVWMMMTTTHPPRQSTNVTLTPTRCPPQNLNDAPVLCVPHNVTTPHNVRKCTRRTTRFLPSTTTSGGQPRSSLSTGDPTVMQSSTRTTRVTKKGLSTFPVFVHVVNDRDLRNIFSLLLL